MRTLVAVILLCAVAVAADYAPMPKVIVEAKTVYIENQSNRARVADDAFRGLRKWNRFDVVEPRDKADLVFVFSDGGVVSTGSVTTGAIVGNSVITSSSPATTCSVTLTVFNNKGERIWANTKPCSQRGAAIDIIRDLQKRLGK